MCVRGMDSRPSESQCKQRRPGRLVPSMPTTLRLPQQKNRKMTAPPLVLTEGGSAQHVALTQSEYRAMQQLALADVSPTLDPGWYDVAAGRKVGAVTMGERQLIVHPKITDLNRLLF